MIELEINNCFASLGYHLELEDNFSSCNTAGKLIIMHY